MKTKVLKNMRKIEPSLTLSMSIKQRRHNHHKNTIMVSWLFVVLLINLVNLTLCNYVNEKESENKISSTTTTTKYANESLLEARELFEASAGMVWSEFLEDYVLRYISLNIHIKTN